MRPSCASHCCGGCRPSRLGLATSTQRLGVLLGAGRHMLLAAAAAAGMRFAQGSVQSVAPMPAPKVQRPLVRLQPANRSEVRSMLPWRRILALPQAESCRLDHPSGRICFAEPGTLVAAVAAVVQDVWTVDPSTPEQRIGCYRVQVAQVREKAAAGTPSSKARPPRARWPGGLAHPARRQVVPVRARWAREWILASVRFCFGSAQVLDCGTCRAFR